MVIFLVKSTNYKNDQKIAEYDKYSRNGVFFMAKIVEDILVVKFSKIVKDSDTDNSGLVGQDVQAALEQVAQELVGEAVVVEVVRAE
jgi:hypothetical protein